MFSVLYIPLLLAICVVRILLKSEYFVWVVKEMMAGLCVFACVCVCVFVYPVKTVDNGCVCVSSHTNSFGFQ